MREIEEIIEARLIEHLSKAVPEMFVIGMLTPFAKGEVKTAPDSHIAVSVDLSSQDMDWHGQGVPCTLEAKVSVNYSLADDASGTEFRDVCRLVRFALNVCIGDGCIEKLSSDGFVCDGLNVVSTSTAFNDGSDADIISKTYNLTIFGRTTKTEN